MVVFWLVVAVAGFVLAGRATSAFSDEYAVPGKEGYETNAAIARAFGNGGDGPPLVPVVTLPRGTGVGSPRVTAGLDAVARRIREAVPGVRVASYATTGDRAFVSRDGRTTFLLAYPPPKPGSFGENPDALRAVRAALRGATVAGAPVHVSGIEALETLMGSAAVWASSRVGGGLGALLVLGFVFASLMAFVPLVVAAVAIVTSLLLVWG